MVCPRLRLGKGYAMRERMTYSQIHGVPTRDVSRRPSSVRPWNALVPKLRSAVRLQNRRMVSSLTQSDIARVHDIIRPYVRRTPILSANGGDVGLGPFPLTLKLEFLQHAGSFKVRGAFTHLLTRELPASGVAAASGGNHGAAVAYAAKRLGVPAQIFVPSVCSPAKIAAIRGHGANVVVGGERYADALEACDRYVAESGALSIHAYDQPETMIGQGTCAREFADQVPDAATVLVAVGGGGFIGGV